MATINLPLPPVYDTATSPRQFGRAVTEWMQQARGLVGNTPIPENFISAVFVAPNTWRFAQFLQGGVSLGAVTVPPTPPAGQFYIYMDHADSKLKAIGPSGTVTPLANP